MKTDLSIKAMIYLRAAELVEQGHCKNWLAKDSGGDPVVPELDGAVEFCLVGSIFRAAREYGLQRSEIHTPDHLITWNNAHDTTAAMVAAKLREQAFA